MTKQGYTIKKMFNPQPGITAYELAVILRTIHEKAQFRKDVWAGFTDSIQSNFKDQTEVDDNDSGKSTESSNPVQATNGEKRNRL